MGYNKGRNGVSVKNVKISFKSKMAYKLTIYFSATVAIALITLGISSVLKVSSEFEKNIMVTSKQTLKEIDNGFSKYLNIVSSQVGMLSKCSYIQSAGTDKSSIQSVQKLLMAVSSANDDIVDSGFASEGGMLIEAMKDEEEAKSGYKTSEWYKAAKDKKDMPIYNTSGKDEITGKKLVRVCQAVNEGSEFKGVVYIDVAISKIIKSSNDMADELSKSAESMTNMAAETTDSVGEVSSAIQNVALGAGTQSESTENAAMSVESLSEKLQLINSDADIISRKSDKTKELSSRGLEMVELLIEKSNRTKDNVSNVADMVSSMTDSIKKINVMAGAIAAITDQTNLLSLNASIEAARAGEAGRGFAVVAEEIRKLADESRKSTDDIRSILVEINKGVSDTTSVMMESSSIIEEQNDVVTKTKSVFSEIMSSIISLADELNNIRELIIKINIDKETVKSKIDEVCSVSQNTAAISEEVTASTEEVDATINELSQYAQKLHTMAKELAESMALFKIV